MLEGWGTGGSPALRPDRPAAPITPPINGAALRIPTGGDTLERMVSDAELVVRGRIVGIERRIVANEPYDDAVWSFVTLDVDETLKGPRRQQVRFAVRIWNDPEAGALDRWRIDGTPLLASLRTSRRFDDPYGGGIYEHARYEFAPRSGTVEDSIIPLLDGAPAVVDMTPALLDRAETILTVARAAARATDLVDRDAVEKGGIFRAEISAEWKDRLGSQFDHVTVAMPVGPRLESRARVWLADSDPRLRWWGVRALGLFRSEANARLLRARNDSIPATPLPSTILASGGPNGETPPDAELAATTRAEIERILRAWNLPETRPRR